MLLLHGLGATGDVWRAYAGSAPDLPGHGEADWDSPYSFEKHARSVELAAEPGPVIGHSMGGVVALVLAALHPDLVTRVVGVGIKVEWSEDDVARATALSARPPVVFGSREEAVDRFLKVSGLAGLITEPLDRAVVEVEGGWRLAQDPATYGVGVPDMKALLAAAQCPVVLARGEHDRLVSHDQLSALVADPVTLAGRGHNVHFEDPDSVLALL